MKKLYSFFWECGRMGTLDGLFIAEEAKVNAIIGKEIYFGEVLGKHSEIYGRLDEYDLKVKSDDQDFINKLEEVIGHDTISGFNPLTYYDPDKEDDEDEE